VPQDPGGQSLEGFALAQAVVVRRAALANVSPRGGEQSEFGRHFLVLRPQLLQHVLKLGDVSPVRLLLCLHLGSVRLLHPHLHAALITQGELQALHLFGEAFRACAAQGLRALTPETWSSAALLWLWRSGAQAPSINAGAVARSHCFYRRRLNPLGRCPMSAFRRHRLSQRGVPARGLGRDCSPNGAGLASKWQGHCCLPRRGRRCLPRRRQLTRRLAAAAARPHR